MQDAEIIDLWKAYDKKLEESLSLNLKNTEEITRMKVKSFLSSMTPIKIFTLIAGVLWIGFVDLVIVALFKVASPYFLISAGIQVLLTKLAVGIYLYQLILIWQTDSDEPVLALQGKVAGLKLSTLWVTRLLLLQLPVWTTFYWSDSMFIHGNATLLAIQLLITGIFTFAAIWLFVNIRYENMNKKWFRMIFSGKEWDPMLRSMELLEQVEDFRNPRR